MGAVRISMRLNRSGLLPRYRTIVRALDGAQPGIRGQAERLLEQPAEMALIGETARIGGVGGRMAGEHHAARLFEPAQDQVPVRAGAEHRSEIPRQLPSEGGRA